MDIGSGSGYPSASLSNFAPHPFVIDGVQCNSMEGFLQSLKYSSVDMQTHVYYPLWNYIMTNVDVWLKPTNEKRK